MKRFLALLICVPLLLAGCSTREQVQEPDTAPPVVAQVGELPDSADGIYQGALILQQEPALLVRAAQRSEPGGGGYQNLAELGGSPAGQELLVHFSARQSLDYLAFTQLDADGDGEEYLWSFHATPLRAELYVALKDFAPGQVLYKLRYRVNGQPERTAYLHKNEAGELFISHNRQGRDNGYADPADAVALTSRLERHSGSPVLQSGSYEVCYAPGELVINNGNGYNLRYYDLNRLFDTVNPDESWGDAYCMLQGDRLTFIVQYRNADEGRYSQKGHEKSVYGVRNFAASFDLSTGGCTGTEKLKRGTISFWETDGDMLYFCHTDVDTGANLYKWDVASFSASAFVYVNTAAGSYAQDELLCLTSMELLKDGTIQLTGLDAYAYEQEVVLRVDLKSRSSQRSPAVAGAGTSQPYRPMLVIGTYQAGDIGGGAASGAWYSLQQDGTFLWFGGGMGYASPEEVSPVVGKGGGWRLEGNEIVFVTMCIAEIEGGVLQQPQASAGWSLSGEPQLRALHPSGFITERYPFEIWHPDGIYIGIDNQLYTNVLWDFTARLQRVYQSGGYEETQTDPMDLEANYNVWELLADVPA